MSGRIYVPAAVFGWSPNQISREVVDPNAAPRRVLPKSDPENGHPFWRETALKLMEAVTNFYCMRNNTGAARDPAAMIARTPSKELRRQADHGELGNLYPWNEDTWDGIKLHVERIMLEKKAQNS